MTLLVIGIVLWVAVHLLKRLAPAMFVVTCVALILCYVPGIGDASKGESRWIVLPGLGRFQPSEPAKLVIMVALAAWFAEEMQAAELVLVGDNTPACARPVRKIDIGDAF